MPIDPSIPLSFNPLQPAPDYGKALTLASLGMQMQEKSRAFQAQNALRELLSNPGSIDPATGMPTPETRAKVMAIDPNTGMSLVKSAVQAQSVNALAEQRKTEMFRQKQQIVHDSHDVALGAYDEARKAGLPEDQAVAAGQKMLTERIGAAKSGGLFSENEMELAPRQFNPTQSRVYVMSTKDRLTMDRQDATTKRQERTESERERHNRVVETRMADGGSRGRDGRWEVRSDPAHKDEDGNDVPERQFRYNAQTGEATTLDLKPYTPAGAAKVGVVRKDSTGDLNADSVKLMAEQYLAGDKSVFANLGRGAQGAGNIKLVRDEIERQAKARNMKGEDVAAKLAEFSGIMAGERAAGTRTAQVGMAVNEAKELAPLALAASEAVSRSSFVPLTRAIQMVEKGTNDENLRRFVAANNSFINVYARAISPTGVPTVSDKDHGREMLDTAFDQKSYKAVVDQMMKEMDAAARAPGAVRKEFRGAITEKEPAPAVEANQDMKSPGKKDGATKVTPEFFVPEPLKKIQDLEWSKSREQFRDPKTGKLYDMKGEEVAGGG